MLKNFRVFNRGMRYALCGAMLLLSACGYRLQESASWAHLPTVYVQNAPPALEEALQRRAAALGLAWQPQAEWQLRLNAPPARRQYWGLAGESDWAQLRQNFSAEALQHGEVRASRSWQHRAEWWEESASFLGHRAEEEDIQQALWQSYADDLLEFLRISSQ